MTKVAKSYKSVTKVWINSQADRKKQGLYEFGPTTLKDEFYQIYEVEYCMTKVVKKCKLISKKVSG